MSSAVLAEPEISLVIAISICVYAQGFLELEWTNYPLAEELVDFFDNQR